MTTLDESRGSWSSASSAEADRLCPGRHQAQQNLSDLPSTPESTTGERIHAIWCGPGCPDATPEELDAAESLFEQERELAERFFGKENAPETMRFMEKRLWHEFRRTRYIAGQYADIEPLKTSGRFDVVRYRAASGRALLIDAKSGWLDVAPNPSNLQLRRLAAMLWLEIKPTQIGVAIIKPHSKPSIICVYDEDDLQNAVEEMERDVAASHDPNAKRVAGEEQCRYCRAQNSCVERLKWLKDILPIDITPPAMCPAIQWSPAQRSLFLEREASARKWLEDRKEEIKALMQADPNAAPGYTLAPGDERETIVDLQRVFERFVYAGGTTEQFLKAVKGVKKSLSEQVRAITGLKGAGLKAKVEEMIAGCCEVKQSAPTIEKAKSLENAA